MVQDINTASQAASQRPQQEAQESVEIPAKCPYFGPSPHRDVWLEGWYAACAAQTAPQQEAQAQAGAVPLTDEQRKDLLAASFCIAAVGDPTATIKPDDAERIINLLHEIGGIKGGQHGTE